MSAHDLTRPNGGYTKAAQIVIIKQLNHKNLERVNEICGVVGAEGNTWERWEWNSSTTRSGKATPCSLTSE